MFGHLQAAIDFTSLGLRPDVFTLPAIGGFGPFALRWYSLAYIGGILLGWVYLKRMLQAPQPPMTALQADDFVTWATLGIIGGGRLGYVLFYNLDQYIARPMEILALWDGGMSFHGGLIGMIVAILWFARRNGIDALRMGDYIACVVPIGQMFGRIANFINGELYGRPTDVSWGVVFPGGGPLARHPSQLYEAAGEGLLLLVVLAFLFWKTPARRYPGLLTGVFIGGFGIARFIIEFFREPDAQLGYQLFDLTRGQWLCVPMILVGVAFIVRAQSRRPVVA
jgi:phosphatidylglycerol:prolipoprotein diacylglycerol transferase